jgi:hypothetical protein
MTTQTKKYIELSDIVGLRFACKNEKCGAVLTLPLAENINLTHPLQKCPHCGVGWAVINGSGYEGYVQRFIEGIKRMEQPFGFALTLELKDEPKSAVS